MIYVIFRATLSLETSSENVQSLGATILAQWIRLHLPSCGPGFESKTRFYTVIFCTIIVIVLR